MEKLRLPDLMSSLMILEWACLVMYEYINLIIVTVQISEKKNNKYVTLKAFQS